MLHTKPLTLTLQSRPQPSSVQLRLTLSIASVQLRLVTMGRLRGAVESVDSMESVMSMLLPGGRRSSIEGAGGGLVCGKRALTWHVEAQDKAACKEGTLLQPQPSPPPEDPVWPGKS